MDTTQRLVDDWQRELADLDASPMRTFGQVNRLAALVRKRLEERFESTGSSLAAFDVLSALRRSGPPYEMLPSRLATAVMLSPSGMTHRIDQLVEQGLVERVVDPNSRRTAPVRLTDEGRARSTQLVHELLDVERHLLSSLGPDRQDALTRDLASLLDAVEARTNLDEAGR